jgi:hypothetical protein
MTQPTDIPWTFFVNRLGLGTAEDRLQIEQFDDWNGDFSFLDPDIQGVEVAARMEATTDFLRLALEYFIAAVDADLPQSLQPHGMFLGELAGNGELAGLGDDALHALAAYVRGKLFPDLPEMSDADKRAALTRVRLTNQDLRDWMYHLVFPDEPPLTTEQCRDPQTMSITEWMYALRKQKAAGGPHWPQVPIVFPPLPGAK